MKKEEKSEARVLRKQGKSMKEIARILGVSKGSVSLWVQDIKLTTSQLKELSEKGLRKEVIERRRATRLTRENARRQKIIDQAKCAIPPFSISKDSLRLVGTALYWAEGSKHNRGVVQFANSDPALIQIMMKFFKEVCDVSLKKFHGHVHLHPHLDNKRAERYWGRVSGIPVRQFYKTSQQHNKASKNKKDSLPYGTFSIYVCNTELFLTIKGWMEGLYGFVVKQPPSTPRPPTLRGTP